VAAKFWLAAIIAGIIGASAVIWLGDSLTLTRILGAILIGLSVTIFTATELAQARTPPKPANVNR
jgi:hypothetical protein